MSHITDQILEQFAERLKAAGTLAGPWVETDRDWPVAPDEDKAFDCLLVRAGADRVSESTPMRPRRLTEEMEVLVRAVTRVITVDGNPSRRTRQLLLETQRAMLGEGADITLGGIAKFIRYAGSEPVEDELNLDVAARDISFIVTFQTRETSFEAST